MPGKTVMETGIKDLFMEARENQSVKTDLILYIKHGSYSSPSPASSRDAQFPEGGSDREVDGEIGLENPPISACLS